MTFQRKNFVGKVAKRKQHSLRKSSVRVTIGDTGTSITLAKILIPGVR